MFEFEHVFMVYICPSYMKLCTRVFVSGYCC